MAKKSKKKRAKQRKSQAPASLVTQAAASPQAETAAVRASESFAPVADLPEENPRELRHLSGTRLKAPAISVSGGELAPAPATVITVAPMSSEDDDVEVEVCVPSERDVEEALAAYDEEQRASRRVAVAVDVHLASDSHFFSGLSGDISEGGLFLSTYRPLPIGSSVEVELSLPGSNAPLHARGEVRWLREHSTGQPQGVGISFDALADDDRERIHRFCTMRPALYYDDVG